MISNQRYLTNTVKFIAALLVVNGHTFMYYSGMPEISRWINIGAQCVSLFLFLSAYGLMCAYQQKGDRYLKGFLTRRLGRILLPLLTAYAIALPVFEIFRGTVDWTDVLLTLYWGGLYLKFSWYVTEILVLYLLFYSCAKLSKSPKQLMHMLTFAVIALMAVMIATQQPLWYINGLPCFIFGLWYQQYEEKIFAVSDKGEVAFDNSSGCNFPDSLPMALYPRCGASLVCISLRVCSHIPQQCFLCLPGRMLTYRP